MAEHDASSPEPIPSARSLLVEANWLVREGHLTVALLAAITACEAIADRAIRQALDRQGIDDLYDTLRSTTGGFDLRNPRACELYESLTRHTLRNEASEVGLWARFTESCEQLDRMLFEDKAISRDNAADTVDMARRLVEMIARANELA